VLAWAPRVSSGLALARTDEPLFLLGSGAYCCSRSGTPSASTRRSHDLFTRASSRGRRACDPASSRLAARVRHYLRVAAARTVDDRGAAWWSRVVLGGYGALGSDLELRPSACSRG